MPAGRSGMLEGGDQANGAGTGENAHARARGNQGQTAETSP